MYIIPKLIQIFSCRGKLVDKKIGIIGGSGLGNALVEQLENISIEDIDTPFGKPSAPISIGTLQGREIAFLNRHGDGHRFMPTDVPYRANIFALKKLGVTSVIASGAVGSLKEDIRPKDLVVVDQFIDKTTQRVSTFFDGTAAVHCELAEPCCQALSKAIIDASNSIETTTHAQGTYVCMEGPQFSTRAESLMHIAWGADLIGMTAMPEAKLAREAQMCYALISLASDYDCWRKHDPGLDSQALLAEIIGNLTAATHNAIALIRAVLASETPLCNDSCKCRKSLGLAVWTDHNVIDSGRKKQLEVLFD